MRAFAICAGRCDFRCFGAGAGVMRPRAFNAYCSLVAVCGRMSVRLASVTLYYGLSGLKFLPVHFYIFNKPGVVDSCDSGSRSERDPINWIFG